MPKSTTYRYKWTGEWRVVLTQHQRPDGSTVEVDPGEEFESTTPVEHELAVSLDAKKDQKTDAPGDPAVPATPEA